MARKDKSINPADAHRRAQHKKEVKKNKLERRKVREQTLLSKDPAKINLEITKYSRLANENRLDSAGKEKLSKLVSVKQKIDEARKNSQKNNASCSFEASNPVKAPKDPTKSIFYDPLLNPFGIPPPGEQLNSTDEKGLDDPDLDHSKDENLIFGMLDGAQSDLSDWSSTSDSELDDTISGIELPDQPNDESCVEANKDSKELVDFSEKSITTQDLTASAFSKVCETGTTGFPIPEGPIPENALSNVSKLDYLPPLPLGLPPRHALIYPRPLNILSSDPNTSMHPPFFPTLSHMPPPFFPNRPPFPPSGFYRPEMNPVGQHIAPHFHPENAHPFQNGQMPFRPPPGPFLNPGRPNFPFPPPGAPPSNLMFSSPPPPGGPPSNLMFPPPPPPGGPPSNFMFPPPPPPGGPPMNFSHHPLPGQGGMPPAFFPSQPPTQFFPQANSLAFDSGQSQFQRPPEIYLTNKANTSHVKTNPNNGVSHTKSITSQVISIPAELSQSNSVISAEPELRNLRKELTSLVPSSILRKKAKSSNNASGKLTESNSAQSSNLTSKSLLSSSLNPGVSIRLFRPKINAAPDIDGTEETLPPEPVVPAVVPKPSIYSDNVSKPSNSSGKNSDDYDAFMKEMEGLL